MRSNYPVSSTEMLTELNDIQETLLSLIGYDANPFDDKIEVSGSIDIADGSITSSGLLLLSSRLYDKINPQYSSVYKSALTLNYIRRF